MILGVLGGIGAGKTTVFNLITGFIRPTAGAVNFKGKVPDTLAQHAVSPDYSPPKKRVRPKVNA